MKLYGYWRSSCTYRIRLALAHKGIEYGLVPVHLLEGGGQQHEEGFRAINPMSQVPVLEVEEGGRVARLGQSMAILEYLEERVPTPPLLPSDPVLRARARQLAEMINSGIQPLQNLFVMQRLKDAQVDAVAWSMFHVRRGLLAYQSLAEETAGKFSIGDSLSVADCFLVPQLYNARRFRIDVETELPLLARIDANVRSLPALAAALPENQPDAVAG